MTELSPKEQLLADLTSVEKEIHRRGWVRGKLISWIENVFRGRPKPEKDHCGAMCMTGAVGVAVEAEQNIEFLNSMWVSGSTSATNWTWSDRGRATLEALVQHMPANLRGRQPIWQWRGARADNLISKIIETNDHVLRDKHDALQWVRAVKAVISQELFEERMAAREAAREEARRAEAEKPVEPQRKVIRETFEQKAEQKQAETA